jgi:uncharacterized protein YdhG (YjbR/CyaY superfamily)
MPPFATIDEYVSTFPDDVRAILQKVRSTVQKAVPGAGETIKYGMPTITLNGQSLVHFAAWKHHIGFYPLPDTDEALEQEVAPYRGTASTGNFPLNKPIPYDLIERLVELLVHQRHRSIE